MNQQHIFFGMLVGGIIILIELLWGFNHSKPLIDGLISYVIVLIGFIIFMIAMGLLAEHKDDAPIYALIFGGILIVASILLTIFSKFDLQNAIFMIILSAIMTFIGLFGLSIKKI